MSNSASSSDSNSATRDRQQQFLECASITEVMREVPAVKGFHKMADVTRRLTAEQATGAPVVDDLDKCIGILTTSDIQRYREIRSQHQANDLHSLDAYFETDQYGVRRITVDDFDAVNRHMTSPVVVVESKENACTAQRLFEHHPHIHHLVVVENLQRPLGIVTPELVQAAIRQCTADDTN